MGVDEKHRWDLDQKHKIGYEQKQDSKQDGADPGRCVKLPAEALASLS